MRLAAHHTQTLSNKPPLSTQKLDHVARIPLYRPEERKSCSLKLHYPTCHGEDDGLVFGLGFMLASERYRIEMVLKRGSKEGENVRSRCESGMGSIRCWPGSVSMRFIFGSVKGRFYVL